jgi:ribonuclease HII
MGTVLGIDEAGRGPVLGPMVLAVVRWSEELEEECRKQNLRIADSKKLSENLRQKTAEYLREHATYRICSVPAWVIARDGHSIPQLEARVLSATLGTLESSTVISDALGSGQKAHDWIRQDWPDRSFAFESGADDRYPSVGAASILAKVARDRALKSLRQDWGELGSGYPSDPATKEWLEEWSRTNRPWPPFVRTNWSTVQRLEEPKVTQSSVDRRP